ncbi:acyl-CoA thioesterase [Altererythrobacter sp. CAU 1778]
MPFTRTFTAAPKHIDVMGHVNNAVWVQWIQDLATAHWEAVAREEHKADYVWLVVRHEIDYRGNISEGESVEATTFIPDPPRGARFDRCVEFRDGSGKVIVAARSTWAMIEKASGRLHRVRPEIAAPFYPVD